MGLLKVESSGRVRVELPFEAYSFCPIDVGEFPYDHQTCNFTVHFASQPIVLICPSVPRRELVFQFGSWSFDASEMRLAGNYTVGLSKLASRLDSEH